MADPAPLPPPPAPPSPPAVPTDPAWLASHAKLVAAVDRQATEMGRTANEQAALKAYFAGRDAAITAGERRAELAALTAVVASKRLTSSNALNPSKIVAEAAALQAEVDKRFATAGLAPA